MSAKATVSRHDQPQDQPQDEPYDQSFAVTAEAIAQFRSHGHAIVRGLGADIDLATLLAELEPIAERSNHRLAPMEQRSTYDRAFLQMFNLWRVNSAFAKFTLANRFASVAAQLLGVPAVRLYHDQGLVKQVGGGHTPWHQDQRYWPLEGAKTVTMWMALVDCTPDMGTMRFASGSHALGDMGPLPISDESEAHLAALIEREGLLISEPVSMAAGDASFHDGWVIHGSGPNSTGTARAAMTVIYVEDGAKVALPDSPERRHDLAVWLPGLLPGDLVDSPVNPRLGDGTPSRRSGHPSSSSRLRNRW